VAGMCNRSTFEIQLRSCAKFFWFCNFWIHVKLKYLRVVEVEVLG
jgi:hypothetical protein